ncbi:MAG: HK97 family phage prohead protease [Sporolactobacillus sp.]
MEKEFRSSLSKLEVRDGQDGGHTISGYAVVFNQPSSGLGFTEYIDSHALDDVEMRQVLALYNHDYANVLARVDTKTLKLTVDEKGLVFECAIPNTTLGNDVFENIRNGNIQGCSFGFMVSEDEWSADKDGNEQRLVKKISDLYEISLTTIPAYEQTSVSAVRDRHVDELKRKKLLLNLDLIDIMGGIEHDH